MTPAFSGSILGGWPTLELKWLSALDEPPHRTEVNNHPNLNSVLLLPSGLWTGNTRPWVGKVYQQKRQAPISEGRQIQRETRKERKECGNTGNNVTDQDARRWWEDGSLTKPVFLLGRKFLWDNSTISVQTFWRTHSSLFSDMLSVCVQGFHLYRSWTWTWKTKEYVLCFFV